MLLVYLFYCHASNFDIERLPTSFSKYIHLLLGGLFFQPPIFVCIGYVVFFIWLSVTVYHEKKMEAPLNPTASLNSLKIVKHARVLVKRLFARPKSLMFYPVDIKVLPLNNGATIQSKMFDNRDKSLLLYESTATFQIDAVTSLVHSNTWVRMRGKKILFLFLGSLFFVVFLCCPLWFNFLLLLMRFFNFFFL